MTDKLKKIAAYLAVLSIIPAFLLTALWIDDIYYFFVGSDDWHWVSSVPMLAGLVFLSYATNATWRYSIEKHDMTKRGATIFSVVTVFFIAYLFISFYLMLNN